MILSRSPELTQSHQCQPVQKHYVDFFGKSVKPCEIWLVDDHHQIYYQRSMRQMLQEKLLSKVVEGDLHLQSKIGESTDGIADPLRPDEEHAAPTSDGPKLPSQLSFA